MKLAGAILLGVLCGAQLGCGSEECASSTVDVFFQPSEHAAGLWAANVATDRCGGAGTEEWTYEVECVGTCPSFTARVFLESTMIAEEPSTAPYALIVAHESYTPDINEYTLWVEADPSVPTDGYSLQGRFTGSEAQVLP
jgi:hypothetical protein